MYCIHIYWKGALRETASPKATEWAYFIGQDVRRCGERDVKDWWTKEKKKKTHKNAKARCKRHNLMQPHAVLTGKQLTVAKVQNHITSSYLNRGENDAAPFVLPYILSSKFMKVFPHNRTTCSATMANCAPAVACCG